MWQIIDVSVLTKLRIRGVRMLIVKCLARLSTDNNGAKHTMISDRGPERWKQSPLKLSKRLRWLHLRQLVAIRRVRVKLFVLSDRKFVDFTNLCCFPFTYGQAVRLVLSFMNKNAACALNGAINQWKVHANAQNNTEYEMYTMVAAPQGVAWCHSIF